MPIAQLIILTWHACDFLLCDACDIFIVVGDAVFVEMVYGKIVVGDTRCKDPRTCYVSDVMPFNTGSVTARLLAVCNRSSTA